MLSVKSALKQLKMKDAIAPLGLVSNPLISLMLKLFSSVANESSKYPIFLFLFLISTGQQFAPSLGFCREGLSFGSG